MARRWQNTSTPDDDTLLRELAGNQISRLTREIEQDSTYKGSSVDREGALRVAGDEGRRAIPIPSVVSGSVESKSPSEAGADAQVARIHTDEESILGYIAGKNSTHQMVEQPATDESSANLVATTETPPESIKPVIARRRVAISIPFPQRPPSRARGILVQILIVTMGLVGMAMLAYLFWPNLFVMG